MTEERFAAVRAVFANELRSYELRPIRLQRSDSESEGWWTPVAEWAPNRPKIGLFFDRILGGDGHRNFWFGFYSTPARIKRLSGRLPEDFQHFATITDDDFEADQRLQWQARRRVEASNGLVFEQYWDDDHYFGKYDIGFMATSVNELAEEAANFVGAIVKHTQPNLNAEVADVNEIEKRKDINETTRKQLIDARRGQGQFRRSLFEMWGGCSITQCTVNEVLRASHIKPWRSSSDPERLDANNGLLLIATLDALFDRGLVSFEDNGHMIISPRISASQDQISFMLHPKRRNLRVELSDDQKRYLAIHRGEVFQH